MIGLMIYFWHFQLLEKMFRKKESLQ